MEKILKGLLIFGGGYFIFDGLLHFLGVKLLSVSSWPESAKSYANLINMLYGSSAFLAALFAFIIQKNLKKYKSLVIISGIWAIFHGLVLLILVLTNNYQQLFQPFPSLLVWLRFYREYLIINSMLLFIYAAITFIWQKS